MTEAALTEMLALVERHGQERCREITTRARQEAQTILRAAHRAVRERTHRQLQELRHHRDRETARAQAELATARRGHQQRCDYVLIDSGGALLRAALLARWRDADARRRWANGLLNQARALLPRGPWRIAHPADWPAAERAVLAGLLTRELGAAPEFSEDRDVTAGLRLCTGGACLDGTIEALLADRRAVEALLLAEIG
ncbi:MAG: hypothetical protein A2151_01135 [Candidatus Muproteobacteria bacterium RBG_16_65_34]|uniref:Uncharacterized protein n=1 Tax=Candidatus Muproteobacteria bacterium RBG_16_65_34 TaxID=1817760 RepID=A0A1F6TRJ6_9PROT|nr:MAG: hypothetical protein A2151_01135 [Candidatus Muproteobacteria bacterium RBG_16_65_34]